MACILYWVTTGVVIIHTPSALNLIATAGSVMSVAWYLTFFAPERYQRFLQESAAARYGR